MPHSVLFGEILNDLLNSILVTDVRVLSSKKRRDLFAHFCDGVCFT